MQEGNKEWSGKMLDVCSQYLQEAEQQHSPKDFYARVLGLDMAATEAAEEEVKSCPPSAQPKKVANMKGALKKAIM